MKPPGRGRKAVISPRETCDERLDDLYGELGDRGRDHGSKTYRPNEKVTQEETKGTTIHEGRCRSKEETGTDDTTNTGSTDEHGFELLARVKRYTPDHGDMTVL